MAELILPCTIHVLFNINWNPFKKFSRLRRQCGTLPYFSRNIPPKAFENFEKQRIVNVLRSFSHQNLETFPEANNPTNFSPHTAQKQRHQDVNVNLQVFLRFGPRIQKNLHLDPWKLLEMTYAHWVAVYFHTCILWPL